MIVLRRILAAHVVLRHRNQNYRYLPQRADIFLTNIIESTFDMFHEYNN
jgi:hypothetical protein